MLNDEIICLADIADMPSMAALWETVFGDDEAEIRAFLTRFLQYDSALVIRQDGQVISMLFLIEAALQLGDRRETIGYIYAGATHPSRRGCGLYRRLLMAAEQEARRRGMVALFLQPADDRLAQTYERLGFTAVLYAGNAKEQASACAASSTDVRSYWERRRALLSENGIAFVDWPLRVYEHCSAWCRLERTEDGVRMTTDAPPYYVLEQLHADSPCCEIPVGRLKPLTAFSLGDRRVYMGYGMD